MRLALALSLLLSACGARAGGGVAWPQMAERESDGGESLAPHPGTAAIAAAAAKDDDDGDADEADGDDDDIQVVSSGTTKAEPSSSASTATDAVESSDDAITIEEIVIEIED